MFCGAMYTHHTERPMNSSHVWVYSVGSPRGTHRSRYLTNERINMNSSRVWFYLVVLEECIEADMLTMNALI